MRILYIIPIIGTLLFSCDLQKDPFDEIAVDRLFESEGAAQTATLGNYALLKGGINGENGYNGWSDDLHRISEYSGDNVTLSGGTTDHLFFLYNYQAITSNSRVARFWDNSYKIIVGANTVIESLEEGQSTEFDQLLGENYYLRALVYFQMGNVFGRPFNQGGSNLSVPLKLTSDVDDRPDRNTVQEVYDQVISDLLKAESLMTIDKSSSFATKEAAQALLSRVYLYMEDNANAEAFADKVIASGRYSLLSATDFRLMNTLNPVQNSEAIFAITLNKDADLNGQWDDWFTLGSFYAKIEGVGWGEMYASRSYLDLLNKNPNDARGAFIDAQYLPGQIPVVYWVDDSYVYQFRETTEAGGITTFEDNGNTYTVESEVVDGITKYFFNGTNGKQYVEKDFDLEKRNGHPKWYITKASLQDNDGHLWSPIVSRLSEMYLNKAEALAKRGMDQEALDNVNMIRMNRDVPTYASVADIPSGQSVLDVILDERRLELAFEGHRKFDVFRNGRTMDRRYPGTHLNGATPFFEIPPTHNRVVEFLPEKQVVLQPSLIQND
ncbi:RagB/SusD family nutrient uptake outer membrane protein [Fulvivirgaceae bacterium BMA10]|uniref:RagB/SusD family nutrient uptake outer membrane protein n=1 Tax=Splendidivirga corallicola TaxID=3051826 RepID=A0ABT8KW68_9BACT|nr:RagB/SusD family nutrient uptake outer membrane protein [Fulvivirgaceae bacterium BMA10]